MTHLQPLQATGPSVTPVLVTLIGMNNVTKGVIAVGRGQEKPTGTIGGQLADANQNKQRLYPLTTWKSVSTQEFT